MRYVGAGRRRGASRAVAAGVRGWPPRSALQAVPRAAALWRSLLPVRVQCASSAPQSPPSLAAPVPFCGGVIVSQPVVRGCRPGGLRLKGLYARPASSGCGGSCRAKRPRVTRSRLASHRSPPWSVWSCKGKPRSGSGAAERRSVACGLSAARTRRPRAVAPPCRRRRPGGPPSRVAGNGLSGKRNDRFVAVVIW